MGFLASFWRWITGGQARDERAVINQLLQLLQGEEGEIRKLENVLLQIANTSDKTMKASYYAQFERELKRFEQFGAIIESVDKATLRRTMFQGLEKK